MQLASLLDMLLYPENGDNTFLWNVGKNFYTNTLRRVSENIMLHYHRHGDLKSRIVTLYAKVIKAMLSPSFVRKCFFKIKQPSWVQVKVFFLLLLLAGLDEVH
jgi:hypothetical protein